MNILSAKMDGKTKRYGMGLIYKEMSAVLTPIPESTIKTNLMAFETVTDN